MDRALLARIRGLGLLSEDAATALEIRWKPPIAATRTDRAATGKVEKLFRRLTRKLRRLASRARTEDLQRLLAERSEAEAALGKPPGRDDDRRLHRYRIRVKRARYLAEDLVASGCLEFKASVARERTTQEVLGKWNDLRLFLERIDRERTKAERRGAVRLASELEDLSRALEAPLTGLRREASSAARRLAEEERKNPARRKAAPVRIPTISAN